MPYEIARANRVQGNVSSPRDSMSEWNSLLMHVSLYRAVNYRAATAGQYSIEQSRAVHYRAQYNYYRAEQYITEQYITKKSRAVYYTAEQSSIYSTSRMGTGQGAEYYRAVYIIEQSSIL